ncbi:MAG: phosphate acetyltransferase [Candidatus Omnitrophica bacterium]|nr:phosphate acetyltransferase [Candidatus Omnitrophota bacterium]
MLRVIAEIREKAKGADAKIVLPEGEDIRVLKAVDYMNREGLVDTILLGSKEKIAALSAQNNLKLDGSEIIEPSSSEHLQDYSQKLYEVRKAKGMSLDEAKKLLTEKPVYFAAMLVNEKRADGFVGGAVHTTRDVARSALYCIGLDPRAGTMSSSFIMVMDDDSFGEQGILIFADCAIVPKPSPKQLCNIAISASDLMQALFKTQPRIAVLSFSTKGSGATPDTENLLKAVEKVRELRPDLLIDGELQGDAALIPEVAKRKSPGSPIGGRANILIFPNLEAGNIAYKLTQRLAKTRALGPLLHGVLAPCSDLSRGCSADDVIDVVCVTALRCAHTKA